MQEIQTYLKSLRMGTSPHSSVLKTFHFLSFQQDLIGTELDNTPTYVQCTAEICPGIYESDFAVQIFKDVATVRDLTSEGTTVDLNKFHYTVAESVINRNIDFDSYLSAFGGRGPIIEQPNFCNAVGFTHSLEYTKVIQNSTTAYSICVNYEGDCEETISPGEVKTCTVQDYILEWRNNNKFPIRTSTRNNNNNNPIK
jgi:hypothetical protein